MRLPLFPSISARSGTSTKGARAINVVSDKNKEFMQKRPALVFSNGYGGLGNGLMDTPNGLFSAWDSAIVDETGEAYIVGSGTLDGLIVAGWTDLYITGMSDDGQTCCGYGTKTSVGGVRAVRLTSTALTELTYPSGVNGATYAYGISGDGSTIVGSGLASNLVRAYKWVGTTATQIAVATTVWPDGGAFGVSRDGSSICGHVQRSGISTGFVYSNGAVAYKNLGTPYTNLVQFFCMSADGTHIGGRALDINTSQQPPIIYNGTTVTDLLPGTSGVTTGVSDDGEYCCGIGDSGNDGFYYQRTGSVLTTLNSGSTTVLPYAISRYGNAVVGERVTTVGTVSMFRWTPNGGFQSLGRITETGTGTGPAANSTLPKAAGCSSMGTTIAVTQFDGATRTPAFWTPN